MTTTQRVNVAGHSPNMRIDKRPTLHIKKKIVPDDRLKQLEKTVNSKYGHTLNKDTK